MQTFVLPDEEFDIEQIKGVEIWTPKYSSQAAFSFYRGWLIFATSKDALVTSLLSPQKLGDSEKFLRIRSDLPRKALATVFINTEDATDLFFGAEKFVAQKPVLLALAGTLPAMGMTAQLFENGITFRTKILTKEGVFSEQQIKKTPTQIMPELANFAPRDVLFFMNGSDLYAKYLHTKNFLKNFHPQFADIFDGILRAESRRILGEQFNFEQDFFR